MSAWRDQAVKTAAEMGVKLRAYGKRGDRSVFDGVEARAPRGRVFRWGGRHYLCVDHEDLTKVDQAARVEQAFQLLHDQLKDGLEKCPDAACELCGRARSRF